MGDSSKNPPPPPYAPMGYAQHQHPAYPPQPGYPPQNGYPSQPGYPPQQGYLPNQGFPSQQGFVAMPMPPPTAAYGGVYNSQEQNFAGKKDPESNPAGLLDSFEDKAVRRGFIRRVYSILVVQLVFTGAVISMFSFITELKTYVHDNRWVMWTSWGLAFAITIILACCGEIRRKTPHNFIFLGLFTACWSIMMGTTASFYDVDAILIAVGCTAAVTLGLTLFAFQTKIDFTACGGFFLALLLILCVGGIVMIFVPSTKYTMIGFGAAGALVFSLYIIYDTQLMMGGSHKYSLSPEEYIFAALNLYLDVTQLFMYILMIVGGARSD